MDVAFSRLSDFAVQVLGMLFTSSSLEYGRLSPFQLYLAGRRSGCCEISASNAAAVFGHGPLDRKRAIRK
jgi:hypothetical protein